MCKLTKEEFLNTRFKENDIEYQIFNELSRKATIQNEPAISLLVSSMKAIAEEKRDLYKQELNIILANQADDFDDDHLLFELKSLKKKNDSGELDTKEYLFKVDEILREGKNKKRKYMQINDTWTRIE